MFQVPWASSLRPRLVATLVLALAAAVLAPSTAEAGIPAKRGATGMGVKVELRKGTKLKLTLLPGKKGAKSFRFFVDKDVQITCEGYDSAGLTWNIEVGGFHVDKHATGITAKLRVPIDASYCGFYPPKKGKQIVATLRGGTPVHDTELGQLSDVLFKQLDIVDALYKEIHRSPSPQEVVDRFAATTGFTPPWPLVAMPSNSSFAAVNQTGIWSDDLSERVSTTSVTDNGYVAMQWDYYGVLKAKG